MTKLVRLTGEDVQVLLDALVRHEEYLHYLVGQKKNFKHDTVLVEREIYIIKELYGKLRGEGEKIDGYFCSGSKGR